MTERPTKTGLSQPARWSTTQRNASRSASMVELRPEQLLRRLDQLLRVEGLADEGLRTALARRGVRLVELAAEHDHGNRPDAVLVLDPAQHFPAAHLGHHHVQEDQVGWTLLERFEAFLGTRGLANLVA